MSRTRILSLLILSFLLAIGLAGRLFDISIVNHKQYVAQADGQQYVERDIQPRRGTIYIQDAAAGTTIPAATSVERFAVSATPKNVVQKEAFAQVIAQATGADRSDLLKSFQEDGEYMPPIRHGLTKEQVNQLAASLNAAQKKGNPGFVPEDVNFDDTQGDILYFTGGVYFIREYIRAYPEGPLLAQALGFVDQKGTGKYGFEQEYNKDLQGYSGKLLLEQDSVGTLLGQQSAITGSDGTSYELSIDRNVQGEVERDLAAEIKDSESQGGSVVVMDPKTGEITAMASQPSYDPGAVDSITQDQVPLLDNPVISGSWEPGSIFKDLVMAAALDSGAVTPDTTSDFPESVTVQGNKIETALRRAYGKENMSQVLANSDNVAMVWVANKLGNQTMYDYLRKFGMGDYTGVDLANEISGSLAPASAWQDIDRATISFGQGIAVTPLQIVTAYAAIANGGRIVQPRMVHAVIGPDGARKPVETTEGTQVIKPATADELKTMMVETVETAHSKAGTPGYKIGGKTGTAQIPDPVKGGYIQDAYNHSFVGIGPIDDPKYVVLVKLDHPNIQKVGTYAESTAVPLFGKISTFLLNYYQIAPTNR